MKNNGGDIVKIVKNKTIAPPDFVALGEGEGMSSTNERCQSLIQKQP